MEDINIGDIYCYSDKKILTPESYKTKRRSTGIGIVVSSAYGIVRIVSLNAHNNGNKYQFMTGNCEYDYNEVVSSKNMSIALRDINGHKNTINIIDQCEGRFTWESRRYLNEINYKYRDELDWYVPSLGELVRLANSRGIILESIGTCKLTEYPLYKILNEGDSLVSSTQVNDKLMYQLNFGSATVELVGKTGLVKCISFKRISIG